MNDSNPSAAPAARPEVRRLRDLSPQQWKSGIAAWLGWLFDGLDMHLYGLVALPFVTALVLNQNPGLAEDAATALAKDQSGIIQAAFLAGWALGGGFFGRLGDILGRSRALSLTILTYACFTGLSFFAQSWWQLLIFRFIAALGIGGEWAVGSALLAETWPKRWRPWIAAVLQTGVNLGVLLACLTTYTMADLHPKWVFLVGVLPAFIVFWIRRHVPEPAEWHAAKASAVKQPGILDLFGKQVRRTTLLTIVVCACGLTAWWAFMFWHAQHLRSLPELTQQLTARHAADGITEPVAKWVAGEKQRLVSIAFFLIIGVSIVGNFFASFLARRFGYRHSIALMYAGFFLAMAGTFMQARSWESLVWFWFPCVGFFSGVFGLFTMYLPPLFPVLLRTTGAGFCYNIGRLASAAGVAFSGVITRGVDFRTTLLCAAFLFLPALLVALILPEPSDENASPE
jgi:MFS family permease